tara:strand:- start:61 stop:264 length:204 start_codon:yes stop_codon:yes gene_type:complete
MGLFNWFRSKPTVQPKKKIISKVSMMNLTKDQLEQIGRENGVELDKRRTKQKLIEVLHKKLIKNSKK